MLWKCCTQYFSKFGKLTVATGLKKVSFHFCPKEGQCQKWFKLPYNCIHFTCKQGNTQNPSTNPCCFSLSHVGLFMTQWTAHQVRLQQYVNQEITYVQAGFWRGRGTRGQIANICWIMEKARKFQNKNLLLLHWLCKSLCVDHNKLWKCLQEIGISNYHICLLRNLYEGQEATVRTRYGTTEWFKIGKGAYEGCILSPCLFNLYAQYILQNARLDDS